VGGKVYFKLHAGKLGRHYYSFFNYYFFYNFFNHSLLLGRTALAAKVQTNANASLPLGLVGIQTVQTFYTTTGKEVIGNIVLQAATKVDGCVFVLAVFTNTVNPLMANTCRQVRTQRAANLIEVVG